MQSFFKSSSVYVISSVICAVIPFLLLPVLTRYLTPEDYGSVAMFQLFTSGAAVLFGLGVTAASTRKYYDKDLNAESLRVFNGNCIIILMFSTIIGGTLCFFLKNDISELLNIPISWIFLGIILVVNQFLISLRLSQWQIRNKSISYAKLQITQAIINVGGSLLMVVIWDLAGEGRVYALCITAFLIGGASLYSLFINKLIKVKFNLPYTLEALKVGVPLIPHTLSFLVLSSFDRFVLANEFGLAVAGIYMVAVQLGNTLNILFQSINKAYTPWLFENLKKDELSIKIKIVKNTYIYFLLLLVVALLGYFISPYILKLVVGEKFHQASTIIGLVIVGNIFSGMYLMVTNYLFYAKKTYPLTVITPISAILHIILMFYLIPSYGLHGAAFSFLIANFIRFILTWGCSVKLYKMPWLLTNDKVVSKC